jgi:hypothetical protein
MAIIFLISKNKNRSIFLIFLKHNIMGGKIGLPTEPAHLTRQFLRVEPKF